MVMTVLTFISSGRVRWIVLLVLRIGEGGSRVQRQDGGVLEIARPIMWAAIMTCSRAVFSISVKTGLTPAATSR
jgi:hypothetical protein